MRNAGGLTAFLGPLLHGAGSCRHVRAALAIIARPAWAARLFAVIPPILSWAYYVSMSYVGEAGVLGLGTAAWFLGACCLILSMEVSSARTRLSGRRRSDSAHTSVYRPAIVGVARGQSERRPAAHASALENRRVLP